jgi:integrase
METPANATDNNTTTTTTEAGEADRQQITSRRKRTERERITGPRETMTPSGPRWYLSFYEGETRRRPHFATEGEAKAEKQRLEILMDNHGRAALADRGIMIDASRATAMLATTPGAPATVLEAVQAYCDALRTLAPFSVDLADVVSRFTLAETSRRQSATLGDAVTRYLAALKARTEAHGYSKFYVNNLPSKLNRAKAYFGQDRMLSDITPGDVAAWVESLRSETPALKPATVSNLRRVFSGLLSYAQSVGLLEANPVLRMPREKATRKSKAGNQVAILTPDELTKLLNAARPRILPFLAIGAFCGIRPEELRRLRWADVDFTKGQILIRADVSKTGDKRHVTMPKNLMAWLSPWRAAKGIIAPDKNERRLKDKAAADAGIQWVPDLLRHSAATYHLAKYRNASLTAEEMGHGVAVLHRHYNGRVAPELAAKWFAIMPEDTTKIIRPAFKGKTPATAKATRKKA